MCTWKYQIQACLESWHQQLPCLVDAYLVWKKCSQASSSGTPTNYTDQDHAMGKSQIGPEAELHWQIRVLNFDHECSVCWHQIAYFWVNRVHHAHIFTPTKCKIHKWNSCSSRFHWSHPWKTDHCLFFSLLTSISTTTSCLSTAEPSGTLKNFESLASSWVFLFNFIV